MKIERVALKNFKRFDSLTVEIKNQALDEIAEQFLVLGDNGTGKTTVLQAIALCLSLASQRTENVEAFNWLGWVPGRYRKWGEPRIELVVHFSNSEIEATLEAAARRNHIREKSQPGPPPGRDSVVTLRLEGERFSNDSAELAQFWGRDHARALTEAGQFASHLWDSLPGVFWFDQFRNLATAAGTRNLEGVSSNDADSRVSYAVGVGRLRDALNKWKLGSASGHDYLRELEVIYTKLFPGHSFAPPEPVFRGGQPSPVDYYFMLSDGKRTYDIEEMSSGEQSVFPLLYEFLRLRIRNSVVLIDEIDLNLHPPLAQALVSVLPELGPDCQFIYTSHSGAISGVVSPEQICRLPGGRLCL